MGSHAGIEVKHILAVNTHPNLVVVYLGLIAILVLMQVVNLMGIDLTPGRFQLCLVAP